MNSGADFDWEEAFEYRPGQIVELKANPGTFDTIADYEATMVPPVWLVNDSRPRYPHELRVIPQPLMEDNSLRPQCLVKLEKICC
jgi:hypothetical protein